MDVRKCQTAAASPAKPGGLPRWASPAGLSHPGPKPATLSEQIDGITNSGTWFWAKTGYDLANAFSFGTLARVEAQENLGTASGVAQSTLNAIRSVTNAITFGLQDQIYETQMREGPGVASITKGTLNAIADLLPVEEAKIFLDDGRAAPDRLQAVLVAVSKTASLYALGEALSSKNIRLPDAKGQGTHPQSLSPSEIKRIYQRQARWGKLRKTEAERYSGQRKTWEKAVGEKLDRSYDVDHIVEKQLGGAVKDPVNMAPLDKSLNRSSGARIRQQIESHRVGQKYGRVLWESERVPVSDGVGSVMLEAANQAANQHTPLRAPEEEKGGQAESRIPGSSPNVQPRQAGVSAGNSKSVDSIHVIWRKDTKGGFAGVIVAGSPESNSSGSETNETTARALVIGSGTAAQAMFSALAGNIGAESVEWDQSAETVSEFEELVFALDTRSANTDIGQPAQGSQARDYWTDDNGGKPRGKLIAEADIMSRMAKSASRVLIVGDGPGAERMYVNMVAQVGTANVFWEPRCRDKDDAQRLAKNYDADVILGVEKKSNQAASGTDKARVPDFLTITQIVESLRRNRRILKPGYLARMDRLLHARDFWGVASARTAPIRRATGRAVTVQGQPLRVFQRLRVASLRHLGVEC